MRDPRDVAESLFEKKKIPREHSMKLWELYNNSLLAATEGRARLLLSYDDLVHRPMETLRAVQAFLGTQVEVKEEDIRCVSARLRFRASHPAQASARPTKAALGTGSTTHCRPASNNGSVSTTQ